MCVFMKGGGCACVHEGGGCVCVHVGERMCVCVHEGVCHVIRTQKGWVWHPLVSKPMSR